MEYAEIILEVRRLRDAAQKEADTRHRGSVAYLDLAKALDTIVEERS